MSLHYLSGLRKKFLNCYFNRLQKYLIVFRLKKVKRQNKSTFTCFKYINYFHLYHECSKELGHLEMVGAIVYQLTRNLSLEEIKNSGFETYYVDHTTGIYPIAASGVPYSASTFQSKGDPITDLHEDLAADGAFL